ncbi:uncharacterized protein LOC124444868 [Xenia sp. Carnegie-2017]|uniref:uncharacterized protein LOC124444868 n=1 Tax=Xenia sp. Carnegie-2017 TaxID=2897299 RepID=UPI001F0466F1|nr:uncharacterized protein LOC124444868 [Xenia sp. Carnegie-2017]
MSSPMDAEKIEEAMQGVATPNSGGRTITLDEEMLQRFRLFEEYLRKNGEVPPSEQQAPRTQDSEHQEKTDQPMHQASTQPPFLKDVRCFICGQLGHKKWRCPQNNRRKQRGRRGGKKKVIHIY